MGSSKLAMVMANLVPKVGRTVQSDVAEADLFDRKAQTRIRPGFLTNAPQRRMVHCLSLAVCLGRRFRSDWERLGPMAEWLRRGLQILARRFDSGSGLHIPARLQHLASVPL